MQHRSPAPSIKGTLYGCLLLIFTPRVVTDSKASDQKTVRWTVFRESVSLHYIFYTPQQAKTKGYFLHNIGHRHQSENPVDNVGGIFALYY